MLLLEIIILHKVLDMIVPDKNSITETLSTKYSCRLTNITRKQIMFEGKSNGKRIVVCTPVSKVHLKGSGSLI